MLVRNRGLVCLLLVFALSLPAVSTRLYASDEIQYFAYLRSLWFDRDLSFENEYRYFYDRGIATAFGFHETFLELTTETGRRLNFATLGCAVLWMPFYGVADVSVRVGRAFGAATPADGFSKPYVAAVTYGSALYGFAAVLISWAVARRLTGEGGLSTSAVWLGTPLLFYMYLAPGMAHACSAFAVSLFVLAWLRVRKRWSMRGMAMLGGLAALMTMVREQDVFYVVGPALDLGWTLTSRLRVRAEAQPKIGQLVKNLGVGAVVGSSRIHTAGCHLRCPERLAGSVADRRQQDDLDRTSCRRGARVTRARAPRLDAAGAAQHRRAARYGSVPHERT